MGFFKSKQWAGFLTRWVCSISCHFLSVFPSILLGLWSNLSERFGSSFWGCSTLSCFGCQCVCGIVLPHQHTRWEAVSGSCAMHRIRTAALLPDTSQRLFGKLNADPQECPTLPGQLLLPRAAAGRDIAVAVCRGPPVSVPLRLCCPGPTSGGAGAGAVREGAAVQRQWLETRRGRAAASLRLGRAGPAEQRAGSRCHRREVGADLPGRGMRCGRHPPLAGPTRGPGGGMAAAGVAPCGIRSPLNFVHVSENCFEGKGRCRISAIEGEKPGGRRLPWASGKGYWTVGQMCEGWQPRGDSLWLAGNCRWCSKVDSLMSNLWEDLIRMSLLEQPYRSPESRGAGRGRRAAGAFAQLPPSAALWGGCNAASASFRDPWGAKSLL